MNSDDLKWIEEHKPFKLKPCSCRSIWKYYRVVNDQEFEISFVEFLDTMDIIRELPNFYYKEFPNKTDYYCQNSIALRSRRYGKIG